LAKTALLRLTLMELIVEGDSSIWWDLMARETKGDTTTSQLRYWIVWWRVAIGVFGWCTVPYNIIYPYRTLFYGTIVAP
jgi:hypothetical protein